MAEYLGSAWLAVLDFYFGGSGSVLRDPSKMFSKTFARVLLPDDLLAGHVLVLVFSQFSGICLSCRRVKRI